MNVNLCGCWNFFRNQIGRNPTSRKRTAREWIGQ
jgi:hypothetical protein